MTERDVSATRTAAGSLAPAADPPPSDNEAAVTVADPAATAFREGTIRIPLRGEEAYAERVAVVVSELVITKHLVYERHVVHDTVRKEHVSVDHADVRPRLAAA